MVHWAGEGSDVILCLARDSPKFSSSISQPSSVYISYNYGTTFKNKTELFKLEGKGYASLEKFFIHPKYNSHVSKFYVVVVVVVVVMMLYGSCYLVKKVNQSRYRPGVAQRVPGS